MAAQNWHEAHVANRTLGERTADAVARGMGSWKYLFAQSAFIAVWMASSWIVYVLAGWTFDPFPWILLNLLFSTQASYSSPIILMAQNRSAERDRLQAAADHQAIALLVEINERQTELIEAMHEHLGIAGKDGR